MSVLIKGMKMPEKCGSCDLFNVELPMHCTVVKGHKTVGAPYGMPRPDWCPLVEVPEPHGDLIDRDAIEKSGRYEVYFFKGRTTKVCFVTDKYLDEFNAVIEAEGSDDT